MGKQTKSVRQTHAASNQGKGSSYEQHEMYDDSLLPDSVELGRLKELDPDVINWIKSMTEREQAARIDFNSRKMSVIEGSTKKAYNIDRLTVILAFIIIIAGMGFSYILISVGQIITGSIFAGVTILLAANSFLNFRKNLMKENNKKG